MDGVVEFGHHVIMDVLESPRDPEKFLETTLTLLFGGVEHTILWKIKRDIWVMWNLTQRHTVGSNGKAIEIIQSTCPGSSRFEGFREVLDNIGGYVAILNQDEAEVIIGHTKSSKGVLPNSFLLHGRGPDRGGGISARVM